MLKFNNKAIEGVSLKSQSGLTLVEVLVAASIVGVAAILILPQINITRKTVSNSTDIDLCRAQVQRSFNTLESGGIYTMAQPVFEEFTDLGPNHLLRPRPYRVPLTEKVSFIEGNNRTFADRFNQFVKHTDLYRVRGANSSDYRRVSRVINSDGTEPFTTENDGITSYLPLLMKGAVSDLADLYIESKYRDSFAEAPSYLTPVLQLPHITASRMSLQLNRIERNTGAIVRTNDPFWPMPIRGLAMGKSDIDNIVRDPDHIFRAAAKIKEGSDNGLGMRLVSFPYGPDIWMSNRFGFRAHFKYELTLTNGEVIECKSSKDYYLPTDQQTIGKPEADFSFLKADGEYDSHQLSDKFYPLKPSGGVDTSTLSKLCSGNCGSSKDMVIKEPKWLAIIANTNFGRSSNGKPLAKNGVDRPTCSQDSSETKTFTFILRFSNLGKDGASIPLCLDKSYRPSALQQYDDLNITYANQRNSFKWGSSSQKDSYIWCEGGNSSADVATGARTLIMNDFLPTQGGYVPCEQLRICGQAPDQVVVKRLSNQAVEYQYQYQVRNSDNRAERNRLWGCVPQFSAVVTDAVGNLMFSDYGDIPLDPLIIADLDAQEILGGKHGLPGLISPNIYFKPPPCYACECKKCKKKKSFFAVIVGAAFFFAGGFMLVTMLPAVMTAVAGITTGILAASAAIGVIGVFALTAMTICGFQMMGLTSGGSCSSWDKKSDFKQFQSCSKEPNQPVCKCGSNCSKVPPPEVVFPNGKDLNGKVKDLPLNVADQSIYGYCGYQEEANRTTDGIRWNVRKGARLNASSNKPNDAFIDDRAVINYSDPNADLVKGMKYMPVDDVSDFLYVNKRFGFACYSEDECYFDDVEELPKWRIKQGLDYDQDINGGTVAIDACGWFKVGYAMSANGDTNLNVSTSPSCITPDIKDKLWGCPSSGFANEFSTQCYKVDGNHRYEDLTRPPGPLSGVWAGKPSSKPPETVNFSYTEPLPNNPTQEQIDQYNTKGLTKVTLQFAQKIPPKCSEVTEPSYQILASTVHGIDAPLPVYGSYLGHTINKECPSKVNNFQTFPCTYNCFLNAAQTACIESNPGFGSCTYAPEEILTYDDGYGNLSSYISQHASCTPAPHTCKSRRFTKFENWYGCTMPEDIETHILSPSSPAMACFKDNYSPSHHASLPYCGSNESMEPDDLVQTDGTCVKKGGGSCSQPVLGGWLFRILGR